MRAAVLCGHMPSNRMATFYQIVDQRRLLPPLICATILIAKFDRTGRPHQQFNSDDAPLCNEKMQPMQPRAF